MLHPCWKHCNDFPSLSITSKSSARPGPPLPFWPYFFTPILSPSICLPQGLVWWATLLQLFLVCAHLIFHSRDLPEMSYLKLHHAHPLSSFWSLVCFSFCKPKRKNFLLFYICFTWVLQKVCGKIRLEDKFILVAKNEKSMPSFFAIDIIHELFEGSPRVSVGFFSMWKSLLHKDRYILCCSTGKLSAASWIKCIASFEVT